MFLSASNMKPYLYPCPSLCLKEKHQCNFNSFSAIKQIQGLKHVGCFATSSEPDNMDTNAQQKVPPRIRKMKKSKALEGLGIESSKKKPTTIPKKPRRGRRSESAAVVDFVRDSLERTFATIREKNPDIMKGKGNILKDRMAEIHDVDCSSGDSDEEGADGETKEKEMVVEEEDPDWPLDADVGWGVRASEYFERHPIRNIVGEDGAEINWEGELDDCLVKEINCLEWESFAFHPSPLIVLVFERYKSASKNWIALKELEKAAKVYWTAKDRLPPRTVKIDINIERDLAYALDVKECPQILFLRGNKIVHREKEMRTGDELVQMIAHIYYNAKRPACFNN
ncbi:unnamed protein product [Cuscuta epithymum]|uniref:Uncharacterized protein n=1 Tax=Cuscuta epithymum TaxID=186058 RepID=A0AAV0CBV2_9ASTE|nr:unnamed protein product [Cuscuta epithymum]